MYAGRDRGHDRGRDRGRKFQKIGVQHDGKNLFLRAFSDFFKKLFRAQNHCFRLFSPVLEPLRARAFSLSLKKNSPKNFFEKPVDK